MQRLWQSTGGLPEGRKVRKMSWKGQEKNSRKIECKCLTIDGKISLFNKGYSWRTDNNGVRRTTICFVKLTGNYCPVKLSNRIIDMFHHRHKTRPFLCTFMWNTKRLVHVRSWVTWSSTSWKAPAESYLLFYFDVRVINDDRWGCQVWDCGVNRNGPF